MPARQPAGLCDRCVHQQLVRTTRGSTFSLCQRSKTEPEYPKYPRLPVLALPRPRAAAVRRAALVAAMLGLVACSPGEPASVASTTAWRPLARLDARPHRGRRGARRPLRLRHGRLRAAAGRDRRRRPSATTCAATAGAAWRDMPTGLNHAAAVAYRGDVYVVGGYRGRATLDDEVATLYRYQPRRNRWTRLSVGADARAARSPPPSIGHRLYAVGGAATRPRRARRRSRSTTSARAAGRPARTCRSPASTSPPRPRAAASTRSPGAPPARATSRASTATTRRAAAGPACATCASRAAASPPRRSAGRIAVFGGEEGAGTIREVELYDPARNRWRRLPDLRTPRHGLGGVSAGRRVYAIEGGDEPGFHFTRTLETGPADPGSPPAVGGPARGRPSGPAPAGRRRGTGCRA